MHVDVGEAIRKLESCLGIDVNHYGGSILLANLLVRNG